VSTNINISILQIQNDTYNVLQRICDCVTMKVTRTGRERDQLKIHLRMVFCEQ